MDSILPFLIRAKQATYAGDGTLCPSSRPGSRDLCYREGALCYYDTYLGSDPFAGEEAVWIDGVPYWVMNYRGRRLDPDFSYDFLKEALRHGTPALPYRGPARYQRGEYVYHCVVDGDPSWFSGHEEIHCRGRKQYEGDFHGGLLG